MKNEQTPLDGGNPTRELSSRISDIFSELLETDDENSVDPELLEGLDKEIESGLKQYYKSLKKEN